MSTAAAERVLPLRQRRDVVVESVTLRGLRRWHLKDPLTFRYWQFGEEELFLWQQLDGGVSLAEWQQRFQKRFAPRRIELPELQEFLAMLHREGLAYSVAAGQAEPLLARRNEQERKQWLGAVTNILAIRFRGIDPERFLNKAYPLVAWFFHPLTVACCLLLILSSLVLLAVHWAEFIGRLPEAAAFFAPQSIVWLAIALASAKVLHELGHAFTNKRFGGECHELGVLLLVFTPCLYCNVSDTWLMSDKWRRMAVSAAGMYVELVLAAAATWLWWLTSPGLLNSLWLSVMVVCSVGTVLFNANPLLRYDGYFILTDLVEVPNLRWEADIRMRHFLARHLLGNRQPTQAVAGTSSGWLLAYSAAAFAYRLFVSAVVLWLIHNWLSSRRLEFLGNILVLFVVSAMVAPGLNRMRRAWTAPGQRPSRWRPYAVGLAALVLGGTLLAVPLPRTVRAPASVQPRDAEAVYVTVPGILEETVRPGTRVTKGQPLATLSNDEAAFQILRLTGERDTLRKHLESLSRQQVYDKTVGVASAGAQRPVLEKALEDTERQLQQRLSDAAKLMIRAPRDGIVISSRPKPLVAQESELPEWSGIPLDPQNIGSFLEAGVLLGYVGNPGQSEALVLLDQADVEQVREGQEVSIQIDELPGNFLRGRVASVAELQVDEPPPEFIAKGHLPVSDRAARGRILGTYYQMKVTIEDDLRIPFGSSGHAKIRVAPQSLGRRLYDSFCRTFR